LLLDVLFFLVVAWISVLADDFQKLPNTTISDTNINGSRTLLATFPNAHLPLHQA